MKNIDKLIKKESERIAKKLTKDFKKLNDKMLSDAINYKSPKRFNGFLTLLKKKNNHHGNQKR